MENTKTYIKELSENGFTVLPTIYSSDEIEKITAFIDKIDTSRSTVRKSVDLFAIRQFLKESPEVSNLIFTKKLKSILQELGGNDFFVIKSIYFDKPQNSNWYVSYHQDLTISVDEKLELEGFNYWTVKQNQFAVQPPLQILENIITIRIHLDKTDENNGALRVIPKSHLKKIYKPQNIDWEVETETICDVEKGGIMIMKPLLLHSSKRTTNDKKRRVIHIEFSNQELPKELNWSEKMTLDNF
ncbi:phytanoyl-CoA dioxygenase family protein (plasmid) [Bernardetia sp. Wsw4-3y2]|uniref:phytanoyl-CoA dioxygenase family protein n=1 Tax=Bernardetia sp. Wsw4-3y2 TaxID=3127471 RepID=UPI0030CE75C2